jgi:hypothetical protein
VQQKEWRDADVVIDNVGLGGSALGIRDFAEPRAYDTVSRDIERALIVFGWSTRRNSILVRTRDPLQPSCKSDLAVQVGVTRRVFASNARRSI